MKDLKRTYNKKHNTNTSEVYGNTMYEFMYSVTSQYIDQGYKADQYGDDCAEKYWKGLLYHQMVIQYAELFYNEYVRQIEYGTECPIEVVKDKMKYDCLDKGLNCLSKIYGGNLHDLLDNALSNLGIDVNIDCDTCCAGLGDMVINGVDECNSFIINSCNNE